MKKSLIYFLIFCFTCALLIGCNAAPESTAPTEAKDPIWGKGYSVVFNAYTVHSGHPSDNAIYCLAEDQHFIYASCNRRAQMMAFDFDPTVFAAMCTDYGYWQDKFSPEYVCENVSKAWQGHQDPEIACYILQLKDGMLMYVEIAKPQEGAHYITCVQILEEKGTQAEFFSYWDKWWQPRQFEDDKEPYQRWRKLYKIYN